MYYHHIDKFYFAHFNIIIMVRNIQIWFLMLPAANTSQLLQRVVSDSPLGFVIRISYLHHSSHFSIRSFDSQYACALTNRQKGKKITITYRYLYCYNVIEYINEQVWKIYFTNNNNKNWTQVLWCHHYLRTCSWKICVCSRYAWWVLVESDKQVRGPTFRSVLLEVNLFSQKTRILKTIIV